MSVSLSLSLKLPGKTAKALEGMAKSLSRPKGYLIQKALESWLAEQVDCRTALDRLRDKNDRVLSSAEIRKRLGRQG